MLQTIKNLTNAYQLLLVPGFCGLHRVEVFLVAVYLQLDLERLHAVVVCIRKKSRFKGALG